MTDFMQHLWDRCKGDPSKFGVIDEEKELFTRYIWSLGGAMIGYQQYNWKGDKKIRKNKELGRYYTYISASCPQAHTSMIGIDMVDKRFPLFVVEGIFEQATATSYGFQSVAVLCNNPVFLEDWLARYPAPTIACVQPGARNVKGDLSHYCTYSLDLPCDLDEMSSEDFIRLVNNTNAGIALIG